MRKVLAVLFATGLVFTAACGGKSKKADTMGSGSSSGSAMMGSDMGSGSASGSGSAMNPCNGGGTMKSPSPDPCSGGS